MHAAAIRYCFSIVRADCVHGAERYASIILKQNIQVLREHASFNGPKEYYKYKKNPCALVNVIYSSKRRFYKETWTEIKISHCLESLNALQCYLKRKDRITR